MSGRRPAGVLGLLFGLEVPVGRRAYAQAGFGLMALKYVVDAGTVALVSGRLWTPLDYLSPWIEERRAAGGLGDGAIWTLALWTLPFLWIGLSMSIRRAADAGLSPWLGFGFLVPFLNYALMLCLAALPSRPERAPERGPRAVFVGSVFASGALAVAAGLLVSLALALVFVGAMRGYSVVLFAWTPLLAGAVGGFALNRRTPSSMLVTAAVGALTCVGAGSAFLLFALEGLICIGMALPLALPLFVAGSAIGRAIALRGRGPGELRSGFLGIALLAAAGTLEGPGPEREPRAVTTSIEVGAPAETVWRRVLAFPPLPEPEEGLFALGVAAPLHARIEGAGVGALRRCVFTTGEFLEPITAWEEGRLLAFDVVGEPAPMSELTPWPGVHPPHLDGFFSSRRGEFRLTPLPGGRTLLEGTTWYVLDVHPRPYWRLWSDALVHAIHRRVLEHVARLAEGDARVR